MGDLSQGNFFFAERVQTKNDFTGGIKMTFFTRHKSLSEKIEIQMDLMPWLILLLLLPYQ
jgi:hypothetical protein